MRIEKKHLKKEIKYNQIFKNKLILILKNVKVKLMVIKWIRMQDRKENLVPLMLNKLMIL